MNASSARGYTIAPGASTIDHFEWGRAALTFIEMSTSIFEEMACKLTSMVAFDVVLLGVAKKCQENPELWEHARSIGIPWGMQSWLKMTHLQDLYNDAVANPVHICPKKMLLGRSLSLSGASEEVSKTTREMWMGALSMDFHCRHL